MARVGERGMIGVNGGADHAFGGAMGEGDRKARRGEVLRLRHRYMIEHIRRAEDPAWSEALERQQTVARLGRMFREQEMDFSAVLDYALDLKERYRR